jgi:hypothetical protein
MVKKVALVQNQFAMKTLFYLFIMATIVIACNESEATTDIAIDTPHTAEPIPEYTTPEPEKLAISFNLYDKQDNPIALEYDDNTIYCAAATWCGFTRKLIELMNDPAYQPVVNKFKFVFLFCRTELSSVLSQVNNDETMSESEKQIYRVRLRKIFEDQDVFDPAMLSDLPGEYHFFKTDFSKDIDGYPNAFTTSSNAFNVNPIRLMARLSPQDKDVLDKMYQKYVSDDH